MFKVSLLPDSYRHRLESRKKIDLISKVALIVLVCLFIVYGGVAIKGQILKSKLENLEKKNAALVNEFPALQEYQNIYNNLIQVRKMIESVSPQDPEAVEFFTLVSNVTPDYIQVTEINLENWFTAGICTISCTAQDYKDVQDYKSLFQTEEMQQFVKLVEITSIQRTVDSDNNKSVKFTLALSMSNALVVPTEAPQYVTVTDKDGEAVTDDEGKVETEVATTKEAETDKDGSTTTTEKED